MCELTEQIEDLKDKILSMYKENGHKMSEDMEPYQNKLEELEIIRQSSYKGYD